VLAQALAGLPPIDDPNVLVGTATADDAGVYRLNDHTALVETVDFFTPIVDEPRTFGRIAAANALSDVYAMGGTPLCALAVACFPENQNIAILADILAGGVEKAHEAGIHVIGGHTVKDPEPKYGLAVTGIVHPSRILRNSTGRAGDVLVLTKPIGTGILTTAQRKDVITERDLAPAIVSMETLNRAASAAIVELNARHPNPPVHAVTDITGFGLVGHLLEMARGSGTGFELAASAVPLFHRVLELAERDVLPGGTRTNFENVRDAGVRFASGLSPAVQLALCDAQTSGGLLAAVAADQADELCAALTRQGVASIAVVGSLTAQGAFEVRDR
jgi:selenide,water dikinase